MQCIRSRRTRPSGLPKEHERERRGWKFLIDQIKISSAPRPSRRPARTSSNTLESMDFPVLRSEMEALTDMALEVPWGALRPGSTPIHSRRIVNWPAPLCGGQLALELGEVEVVAPGRDLAAPQLEAPHHGQLDPAAADLEAIRALGQHHAGRRLGDLVQHPLDLARHAGEALDHGARRRDAARRLDRHVVVDAVVAEERHDLVEFVAPPRGDEAPNGLEVARQRDPPSARTLGWRRHAGGALEFSHVLHLIGALVTFGMGVLGLARPLAAARLVGLAPEGPLGLSELRATYGGLFTALGAFALATRDEVAFVLLGAAWLGAAAARCADAFWHAGRDRRIWRAALFEAAVALLLLAPV